MRGIQVYTAAMAACLVLDGSSRLSAQDALYSIQLRVLSGTTVEVTETNRANTSVTFPCNGKTIRNYIVLKEDGTPAEDTEEGIMRKTAAKNNSANSSLCVSITFDPGQTVSYPLDLSRFYKMQPGLRYSARIEQSGFGGPPATSNIVTLEAK